MKTTISHYRLFARIALTAPIVLALGACDEVCCVLSLDVSAGWGGGYEEEIAGLEVEVNGQTFRKDAVREAGGGGGTWLPVDTRQNIAPSPPGYWTRGARVGSSGNQHVFVRLVENSRVVADGSISWKLVPNVFWDLDITRDPPDVRPLGSCGIGYWAIPVGDAENAEPDDVIHLCLSGWFR